ncbi:MAG TPA: hypothetical protein ENG81_01070 [Candidatus Bathyarchaeota archaeon]|nr:hypothetical protein [Candidatus Bathyarchaeota archaeon]
MNYPREHKIENEELKKLIIKKGEIVKKGRAKSNEIAELEIEMDKINTELMAEEKKVDLKEFGKREKAITDTMEKCIKDMDKVKLDIYAKMKEETSKDLRARYDEANKSKEKKENERNKIALKAQKFNDKIIPLGREIMTPFLEDEYEDYSTIMVKDGEIIATVFSHLQDWKIAFNKKRKV